MAVQDEQPTRKSGRGDVTVQHFGESSSKVSYLSSAYPLRLISPRPPSNSRAVLVFVLTYGGGLVAGDETNLRVLVRANAKIGILTQGSTKIYKSPSSKICTTQTLTATIHEGAALLILPDPVHPFADSVYQQRQIFEMDHFSSNLLLLDWVCEGRSSRGESWSFTTWRGCNEIWSLPHPSSEAKSTGRRLLLRDNIKLDRSNSMSAQSLQQRMEGMGVFGIVVIAGPMFQKLGHFFLERYAALPRIGEKTWSTPAEPSGDGDAKVNMSNERCLDSTLTWTATSIRNFVIVRFHARTVELARRWLREMLTQDGTVEREFGHQHMFCLQDR